MSNLSFLRHFALGLLISVSGCVLDDSVGPEQGLSSIEDGEGAGEALDRDDCKVEDDELGQTGVLISLNGVEIDFEEWIAKDGEPGEYIGFTIAISGAERLPYTVKTGTETFEGDSTVWLHPNGTGGSDVSAVSHVDFCDGLPGDGDPGDGDPGDGDPGDGDPGDGDPGDGVCFSDAGCSAGEICGSDNLCHPIDIE